MADRLVLRLYNAQQGYQAIKQAWEFAKGWLVAGGKRLVLEVRPETRSDRQNRLLHALLDYISKNMEWAGKKRDTETWKRLMVAAWCRAKNEQVEILPAIDGHGVDIVFRKTSKLTIAECADLIEFIFAWCAMNDLQIPDISNIANIDYEAGEGFQ